MEGPGKSKEGRQQGNEEEGAGEREAGWEGGRGGGGRSWGDPGILFSPTCPCDPAPSHNTNNSLTAFLASKTISGSAHDQRG